MCELSKMCRWRPLNIWHAKYLTRPVAIENSDDNNAELTYNLIHIAPPRTSCCPGSCSLIGCRSLLMYFSVRTHFTQQDFESAILSDRVFDYSHCVLSLTWTSTDLPPISGICRRFRRTCWRVKIGAKIEQCELGIISHMKYLGC